MQYSAKVCMRFGNQAKNFAKEFMQECWHPSSTPRKGAADSNAPRIPPSQYLWLGGLEGMRDWRAWRGTGIGEAGLGRTQQLSSKQWSKAIRTC